MTNVLVVDDDVELVKLLARIVHDQGWEAGVAYDGVEATRQVKRGKWDAVLLDIKMPKLDGLAALRDMRQYDPDLAVILITGDAAQGDMMEAYRAGAYTCLVKPLEDQEVVKAIREALEREELSRSRSARAQGTPAGTDTKKKTKPLG